MIAANGALFVATAATGIAWLLAAGLVYLARRPREPPVGPKTLDLGGEPPAIANFLVSDFRVTEQALPATLIDLAARNVVDVEHRGPGVFFIRLRLAHQEALTSYERRVLAHLYERASDGVVPAEALTTGPTEQSAKGRRAFEGEVVDDAKARGLSRDALDTGVFTALGLFSGVPGLLVWIQSEFEAGAIVVVAAVALLGWIRARHPQRETPAGMVAASRWLGVRAALAEDEEFARQSPLTVELWNRHLAYGAALGVESGATGPLPMGTESDTRAWSAYSGRWRPVRIAYPRLWPPAWGRDPVVAFLTGIGAVVASGLVLYTLGPLLTDGGPPAAGFLLIPCAVVILGVAVVVMAWSDWMSATEVTGPILRLRVFGDEKNRRYYVAVDDGTSRTIRAWRVSPAHYTGLEQGEVITARLTSNLCCVRWIVRPDAPNAAG